MARRLCQAKRPLEIRLRDGEVALVRGDQAEIVQLDGLEPEIADRAVDP
jgi:hypothetical protein